MKSQSKPKTPHDRIGQIRGTDDSETFFPLKERTVDEIFEEPDADRDDFVGDFYWSLHSVMDPIRCELILAGGDVRLAGVATDGRVIVRLMGPFTKSCMDKRAVVEQIEQYLKSKDDRVTQVLPVCPNPEETL
jgi:Fe-S cluster biogenesis protein NfuA